MLAGLVRSKACVYGLKSQSYAQNGEFRRRNKDVLTEPKTERL